MARTTTKKTVVAEESVNLVDFGDVMNAPEETNEPEKTTKKSAKKIEKNAAKEYAPTDLINCISITTGYMNYQGRKTGTVYSWENTGDITAIEYQDLRAAMLSRSTYIYSPLFIIDDDELLELPEWSAVKKLYEDMYSPEDLGKIFSLGINEMVDVIQRLPVGAKKSLVNLARTMMVDGRLDSLQKIRRIDEILGTELSLFIDNE